MEDQNILVTKKAELLATAKAMLSGEINLIEGVRLICLLRFEICDPENKVFLAIRGVDSETDHLPLGVARLNWDSDALRRKDEEMEKYLADAKCEIQQACREIVQTYSSGSSSNP